MWMEKRSEVTSDVTEKQDGETSSDSAVGNDSITDEDILIAAAIEAEIIPPPPEFADPIPDPLDWEGPTTTSSQLEEEPPTKRIKLEWSPSVLSGCGQGDWNLSEEEFQEILAASNEPLELFERNDSPIIISSTSEEENA